MPETPGVGGLLSGGQRSPQACPLARSLYNRAASERKFCYDARTQLEKPMATYNVLTVTRTGASRDVTSTDCDGSSVTLDTACGTSGISLVLNETVLKASNPAANISSIAEELLETLRAALHNQTRV
jgi:hypothetical protein